MGTERVGAYELTGLIGEGGMGAVYEARRADDQFERRVAIKMMRQGLGSDFMVKRFLNERQVLARLEHPGIARMFDGGLTEHGQPYFVMELVAGQPLDQYVEDRKLPLREKLTLFRKLCDAVAFAHSNLVVHRDLKPQNVLVTATGEPKLLDFGIAKLVDSPGSGKETVAGFRVVTPRYASPEQFSGVEVSTRSDIYSLGIMLYELLTARSPYGVTEEFDTARWIQAVTKMTPPKPNSGPDLDAIVMKAIAKDPEDRYATVEQMSQDILAFLESRPVSAREYRPVERVGKFVRRNKLAVAGVSLLLITLTAGVIGTWWQGRIARQERELADRRFIEARDLARLFLFDFYDAVIELPGSTPVQRVLIDKTMQHFERMERAAREDATLLVELAEGYRRMGDLLGNPYVPNLGDTPKALTTYQRGLDLFKNHPADRLSKDARRAQAGIRTSLAAALAQTGEAARGKTEMESSEKVLASLAATYPTDMNIAVERATLYNQMADLYNGSISGGTFDATKARDYLEKSCESWRTARWLAVENPKAARGVAICQIKLGTLAYNAGDAPKAIEQLRQALDALNALPESVQNQQKTLRSKAHATMALGNSYMGQGDWEKAVSALTESVTLNEQMVTADPRNAQTVISFAQVLRVRADVNWNRGDKEGSRRDYERMIQVLDKLVESQPANVIARTELGKAYRSIAQTHMALKQPGLAREESKKAFELLGELARRSEASADVAYEYAITLAKAEPPDLQRVPEAIEFLEKAHKLYGGKEPYTMRELALLHERAGNKARAIELLDQLLTMLPESTERERVKNKKKDLGG